MDWLEDHSFIYGKRYKTLSDPGAFTNYTLTDLGLKVLNAVPEVVDPEKDNRSFGDRLLDAVEKGKREFAIQDVR